MGFIDYLVLFHKNFLNTFSVDVHAMIQNWHGFDDRVVQNNDKKRHAGLNHDSEVNTQKLILLT